MIDKSASSLEAQIEVEKARVLAKWPELAGHIELLERCCTHGPAMLRGQISATEVIFPDGSMELASAVYSRGPTAEFFNELIATYLAGWVGAHSQRSQTLRILELGAGTGGTTARVLERLNTGQRGTEYWYTDVSQAFLLYGRQRFAAHEFVRYALLDIEGDPAAQGFDGFDVILACNVLHATSSILATLANVRKLMNPGAMLILSEATAKHAFTSAVFGLLDGWWKAADPELRLQGSPLLCCEGWARVLSRAGFEIEATIHDPNAPSAELSSHSLMLCAAPPVEALAQSTPAAGLQISSRSSEQPTLVADHRAEVELESAAVRYFDDKFVEMLMLTDREQLSQRTFEELGIDSIVAINLKYDLERELQVTIPISMFHAGESPTSFKARVLQEQACTQIKQAVFRLQHADVAQIVTDASVPKELPSEEIFPLTSLQESFLIGKLAKQGGCHVYAEIAVPRLDVVALERAWRRLVEHHDMLRTCVLEDGQRTMQRIPDFTIETWDKRAADHDDLTRHLEEVRARMSHELYPPGQWPLFTLAVTHTPEDWSLLHFSIDEWIVDGASIDLLFVQLWGLYYGTKPLPPKPTLNFAEYVALSRGFRDPSILRSHLEYWDSKLTHCPGGPQILGRTPAPDVPLTQRVRHQFCLAADEWVALKLGAKELGVSPSAVLLAAFTDVLQYWSASTDFSILMTVEQRFPVHAQVQQLIGPFTATAVVLPVQAASFSQRARAVQQQIWEDLNHLHVSGVEVLRELKTRGRIPRDRVIPVVFSSRVGAATNPQLRDDSTPSTFYKVTQTPFVWLDSQLFVENDVLHVAWDVQRAYLSSEQAQRMLCDYGTILRALASDRKYWSASNWDLLPQAARLEAQQDRSVPFPMTAIQAAYMAGRFAVPRSGQKSCIFYQEYTVSGLTTDALQAAITRLLMQHEMLRASFHADGTQTIYEVRDYRIATTDLSRLDGSELDAAILAVREEMLATDFPPGSWPLFEIRYIALSAGKACVHVLIDLIMADGNSIQRVLHGLLHEAGPYPSRMSRRDGLFQQYVMGMERFRRTDEGERDSAYWRARAREQLPPPELPQASVVADSWPTTAVQRRLTHEMYGWSKIKVHARRLGIRPTSVLLASFLQLLEANVARPGFTVVVVCWDRPRLHVDLDAIVGDFTRLAWMNADRPTETFVEKLVRCEQTWRRDLQHGLVSGVTEMGRRFGNVATLGRTVVFSDIMQAECALPPGVIEGFGLSITPGVCLDCINHDRGDTLVSHWDVNVGIIDERAVRRMFQRYCEALEELPELIAVVEPDMLSVPATVAPAIAEPRICALLSELKHREMPSDHTTYVI